MTATSTAPRPGRSRDPAMLVGSREELAIQLAGAAAAGRLVLVTGPSGSGRTELLHRVARLHQGPVLLGGGMAGLRNVPNLALSRALRLPVPAGDSARAADFVLAAAGRSTLLVLDDLQLCDPATLEVIALLAGQLPIASAVQDDTAGGPRLATALARLPSTLRAELAPLQDEEAAEVARSAYRGKEPNAVRSIVRAGGGNPAALVAMAHDPEATDLRLAVAHRLALLSPAARTALCLIGLLGRPAEVALLGTALAEAGVSSGVLREIDGQLSARSNFDAGVAIAVLPAAQRRELHARLARRVPDPGERARHFEAAGEIAAAVDAAREGAARASSAIEAIRYTSIAARLTEGAQRPEACLSVALAASDVADHRLALYLAAEAGTPSDWRVGLVGARAALSVGDVTGALDHLGRLDLADRDHLSDLDGPGITEAPDGPDQHEIALLIALERARALCLVDPIEALDVAAEAYAAAVSAEQLSRAGAVLGAAQLAAGADGWAATLEASEAHARDCGLPDVAFAACANRCSGLLRHGQADAAQELALSSAWTAAQIGATNWTARFRAVGLWVDVHVRASLAAGVSTGQAMLDGPLAPALRHEVSGQVALAYADSSDFAAALAELDGLDTTQDDLLGWCDAEVHALQGDQRVAGARAAAVLTTARRWPVPALAAVTAAWAGVPDLHQGQESAGGAAQELAALSARDAQPARAAELFADAADRWEGLSRRSALRCRLGAAVSLFAVDPDAGLARLRSLATELENQELSTLSRQVTRARRRLGDTALPIGPTGPRRALLSRRETEVMAQVAQGLTSAAIAGRLGVAPSTVETQVKSAMRKLGATTRTEAAILALQ